MRASFWISAMAAAWAVLPMPALFAGDEMAQMHTQVDGLTEEVSRLQRSLDGNIGIVADLLNRNSEATQKIERDVEQLQKDLKQQNQMDNAQAGKISVKVANWQAELSTLESRLEAVTRSPLTAIAPQAPSTAASTPPPGQPPVVTEKAPPDSVSRVLAPAPSPAPVPPGESADGMDLYRSAMQNYAAKDLETAATEFEKFLKIDHQSETATSARFYLAEIEFEEKDFEGALDNYTVVGPQLSNQAKAAHVQYRKALCLVEVDREDEAILELQALRTRYPNSAEAAPAAKKLRALTARNATHP